jgi:2-polyprenyl-6-methoxyphenol hydroxylase-like FAD-dependent oxidoreductase
VPLRLGIRCTGIVSSPEQVRILFDDGSDEAVDLIVGADGVHSSVRASLAPDEAPPTYAGTTAWRAVVHAPGLVPSAWLTVGGGRQFLAAPLPDGDVYWSSLITMPLHEIERIDDHLDRMRELFGSWHDPIPELLRLTDPDACFATPVLFRPPPTWLHQGRVVLIGDAAHPMTPDLGQGACQAIEDAVVLSDCLRHTDRYIESMLEDFTSRRLQRVRRIVREARQLGRLNASPGVVADVIRSSAFRLVPKRYSQKHLRFVNGRDAFDSQLTATS